MEENAQLEFEKKSSFNESATLEEELMRTRTQLNSGGVMSNMVLFYVEIYNLLFRINEKNMNLMSLFSKSSIFLTALLETIYS